MKPQRMMLAICAATLMHGHAMANGENSLDTINIGEVVVTATREEKPLSEVAENTSIIKEERIRQVNPAHPSEILNQVAGVHVNNLGGEGHMTSIRQPISTGNVYVFLEDGLPTRPSGFFNHNGLYEINIPQAERVEVTKGPGTALYGSDSIGGLINVITKQSPDEPELSLNAETGSYDWRRFLISGGSPIGEKAGFRLDLNSTQNGGYRDSADYERTSGTLRLDGYWNEALTSKAIISLSHIDQAGVDGLDADDYYTRPQFNRFRNDVARREVTALRVSNEFSYELDNQNLFTFTPFYRYNNMKLMPSWMINFDPNDRDYDFQSFGAQTKYRYRTPDKKTEFITGVDVDYSPSTYREVRIDLVNNGEFIDDTTPNGRTNYDFDANQLTISPYIHTEHQVTERFRATAGLRYDYISIDYTDNLAASVSETGFDSAGRFTHLRPDSQTVDFEHLSPKLGLIYNVAPKNDIYANYRHSFQAPTVNTLFRPGSTPDSDHLKPMKTDSFEVGLRGSYDWLSYNATYFYMMIDDLIVNYVSGNDRLATNAGETIHQGIELTLNGQVTPEWAFQASGTYTHQEYEDFTATYFDTTTFSNVELDNSGNKVARAPTTIGNLVVEYKPKALDGTRFEVEWEHLGEYYVDETNTSEYEGHNLFNFRTAYEINDDVEIYGRLLNITDRRYSVLTSRQPSPTSLINYRPGNPRTVFAGIRAKL
ncbi:MAG: TonB-dependent receptor [Pseudomonadota bacterium]